MTTPKYDPYARKYAIGDFARKAGVSTHFLKFYEEKGILHPTVQENGYRHYDIRDASLVLECFRMKNMGLSVRQIEKGVNNCTEQEVVEMLEQREKVFQKQIRTQQMHLQGLHNLRAALRLCERNEWSVRTVPDVWYLPHTIGREFVQDDRIYEQLPGWLEWMPVVTSAQIIYGNDEGAERMEWGLGLEQAEAELLGFAPQDPARLLHLGRVLEIYCSWDIPEEKGSKQGLYRHCMERARALNLVPEPVLFRRVFCYTEKNGIRQVHNVLRMPVRLQE